MTDDFHWMGLALAEARKAHGACHPNPAVGAVVVENGTVCGRGHTQAPGQAHAEVEAIRDYLGEGGAASPDATLYVTLEPCCTHGRTPPCTDLIIAKGIRRVVVAATDPNPLHSAAGFTRLRAAGVEVIEGVRAEEAADLNLSFNHWISEGSVFWAGKIATTLDGRIATRTGHSRWITSPEARQDVALWRRSFPAIAVGGGTVVADDPTLSSRPTGAPEWSPRRLIFDRQGRALQAAPGARVFTDSFSARSVYITRPEIATAVPARWRSSGVAVWDCADDLAQVEARCLAEGLTGVYCEGGPGLLSDLLARGRLHYLFAYRAPKWLGDADAPGPFLGFTPKTMGDAFCLEDVRQAAMGPDQLLRGRILQNRL